MITTKELQKKIDRNMDSTEEKVEKVFENEQVEYIRILSLEPYSDYRYLVRVKEGYRKIEYRLTIRGIYKDIIRPLTVSNYNEIKLILETEKDEKKKKMMEEIVQHYRLRSLFKKDENENL